MTLQPKILWAQTKEAIFLTVEIQDTEDIKIDLEEENLNVSAVKGNQKYAFQLQFLHPINVDKSAHTSFRELKFKLVKKEEERWTKVDKRGKFHWLQCDWQRWIDTDDEENGANMDMGFNPANFDLPEGDMGEDSDDERGMPDLSSVIPPDGSYGDLLGKGMDGLGAYAEANEEAEEAETETT
ncbi:hypothetical protein IE077_003754 [Cardiosporidium cionae]|uniref:CS domain-containing protein n=1 Tax=Cardiosporidium cionae TaxID=476202 RepID=A0ABQ7J7K1_9APIC|nr:hypothetical protein IE077_003754 [Cardiosporidium cionae]|eukprot:KAF8819969.1 hypothetical protein IE077_003754 [Cardiosporidium cionae]